MCKVKVFMGNPMEMDTSPREPFSTLEMEFFDALSKRVRKECGHTENTALKAFGFWCRKPNLSKMQKGYSGQKNRLGLGLLFQVCPSNVPGLFLWSSALGLLTGNSCLVRVSERREEETEAYCRILEETLNRDAFQGLQKRLAVVTYPRSAKEVTDQYSKICDGRVIWGGDPAVQEIRQCPLRPGAAELAFPDRASAMLIDAGTVLSMDKAELESQCGLFYQDAYAMDQNACSSPRLILWYGEAGQGVRAAKEKWWECVQRRCMDYAISEKQIYDKFHQLCEAAINLECEGAICDGSRLCRIELSGLSPAWAEWKGNSGAFLEYSIHSLEEISKAASPKLQTLVTLGIPQEKILEAALSYGWKGICRIVLPGQALGMDMVWDGKSFAEQLTRIIHFR